MSITRRPTATTSFGGGYRIVRAIRPAAAILTLGALAAVAQTDGNSDNTKATTATLRARSCVLKVECLDRSESGVTAVLSAVSLDDDGNIVTIGLRKPGDRTIVVRDCSGKKHEAKWVAADDASGLVLLKLQPGVAHPPPMLTALPEIGSPVIVVGNAFGLSHSVSIGVVSGLDRTVSLSSGISRGLIQFSAPVFPGDGGGLLADRDGRMIGLVSTALNEPGTDDSPEHRVTGIGFAIPAPELRRVAQRLRDGQRVERGYLGLTAQDVDAGGIRVTSVAKNSPAQAAGLLEGDVIEAMDDREVRDFDGLAGRIERLSPGSVVHMQVRRGDESLRLEATLTERTNTATAPWRFMIPPWANRNDSSGSRTRWEFDPARRIEAESTVLGVHTQAVTESLAKSLGLKNTEGALVSSVTPDSPAGKSGIKVSDVIVSLDDDSVRSPLQLHERIRKLELGSTVSVGLVRDGVPVNVQVTLGKTAGTAREEITRRLIVPGVPLPPETQRSRLEALEDRVKILEARLEELQKRLDVKASGTAEN
jgi:serine protease Do